VAKLAAFTFHVTAIHFHPPREFVPPALVAIQVALFGSLVVILWWLGSRSDGKDRPDDTSLNQIPDFHLRFSFTFPPGILLSCPFDACVRRPDADPNGS